MISLKKVFDEISKVIAGDGRASFLTLMCMLAKGHLLIEDVPGVGKTLLASSLAKTCSVDFKRVQCTPDIMPGDILGFSMFDINTGETKYIKGPVMTNLLLVDEINRASPKTQSALLEVMEEYKVTVDGKVFEVPSPFMVIATQNPIENAGTSPLPEAQLDRFTMRVSMGYPNVDDEVLIVSRFEDITNTPELSKIVNADDIIRMQNEVAKVTIKKSIIEYTVKIIRKTREHPKISLGCSPRAALALVRCAKAKAYMVGRNYVIPDDIKTIAADVLSHRIILTSQLKGVQNAKYSRKLIKEIISETEVSK